MGRFSSPKASSESQISRRSLSCQTLPSDILCPTLKRKNTKNYKQMNLKQKTITLALVYLQILVGSLSLHPRKPSLLCRHSTGQKQKQSCLQNTHIQAYADPQCCGLDRSRTLNSPQRIGTKRKWPHTVGIVQLTRRHTSQRPRTSKLTVRHSAVTTDWVLSTIATRSGRRRPLLGWIRHRVSENKHNAATGIISGSVDTGQRLFLCSIILPVLCVVLIEK